MASQSGGRRGRWAWIGSVAPAGIILGALVLASCESERVLRLPDLTEKPSTPGPKATFASEPEVRVRVAGGVTKKQIEGPGRMVLRVVSNDPAQRPRQVPSPVTVVSGPNGIEITDGSKAAHRFPFGTDVEIAGADAGANGKLTSGSESVKVGGVSYPGFVVIHPAWSTNPGSYDIVVSMPVESYLPGVLSHELFKEWPRQTFECQAVAARTYALHERARARAEGKAYDVEDTTQDQVYGGVTTAPKPNEAAVATRGLVLTSNGKLIRAYYSSACGGRPNSAAKVWPTGAGYEFNLLPPLQGAPRQHYCQGSRFYRWEVTRTDDDVSRRLRAWGKGAKHEVAGLSRVRSVEVEERNKAERPVVFKVRDDRGREFHLTSEELRNGLNQVVTGLAPITNENRVNSGDVEVEVYATQVRIRGRGWGHGVGMCQWCAKGMADAGLDWRSMIKDFYPGAEVVKAY